MSIKWYCEDGKENVIDIFDDNKIAFSYAMEHPNVMEVHEYEDDGTKCVWRRDGWDGFKYAPPYIMLRDKKLSYSYSWVHESRLIFDIGDGELSDKDGNYFIHISYETENDDCSFYLFWDDDMIRLKESSEDYLTEQEMEYLKQLLSVKVAVWNN